MNLVAGKSISCLIVVDNSALDNCSESLMFFVIIVTFGWGR